MSNPTAAELIQEIIPLDAQQSYREIFTAGTRDPSVFPAQSMNRVRLYGIEDGIERLETMASDGSISVYFAGMLAAGAPGSGAVRPGIMNRDGEYKAYDPYMTNPDGTVRVDMVATIVGAEARRIAEGPRDEDRGTAHTFFLNGHDVLPVTDAIAFTSGFSAEIFDDYDIQRTAGGYTVQINDMSITLTQAEFDDIRRLSFNGGQDEDDFVALDDPRQNDAIDAYGRAKIVAAGIVHARQHEQTDDITYEGSIPSLPNTAQLTSSAAARQ